MVRGAALLAIGSVVMAGCSADDPGRDRQIAALNAAVLTLRDMPRGFLPAQDQRVFGGLSPHDPDCRRLLALADLDDLRDRSAPGSSVPPQAHAVFYRAEPGSTMAEHLVSLNPVQAQGRVEDVRRAAAGCPLIELAGPVRRYRRARPPGHRRTRDLARGLRPGPGHRGTPWYRYWPEHDGRPGSGGHRHGGHGHDRYGRDGYGRDGYGRDGYGRGEYGQDGGRDGYGQDGYAHDGHGHDGYGQDGYGQDGRARDEHRSAPGEPKRGRSGLDGRGVGEPGSGEPGRGRSGPAEPRTGRGGYGSVPGEPGREPHGHGRFGLGFGPGYGERAHRPGLVLHRVPMALPGLGGNVYGVRYSGQVGHRYQVHFDLVVAELGDRLLIMEQPVLIVRGHPGGDSIVRIARAALQKLHGTTAVPETEPLTHPSTG